MLELVTKVRLSEHIDPQTKQRTIRADITNMGDEPIGRLSLAFEYEYETPQDISFEYDRPPGRSIRVEELGRQVDFEPITTDDEALQAGQSRTYLLPTASLAAIESVVAALSPERYGLVIAMNGHRQVAAEGTVVGSFVQAFVAEQPAPAMPEEEAKQQQPSPEEPADRMQLVHRLVARISECSQRVEILPPRQFTRDPASLFGSEEGFQKLAATQWCLRFEDGREVLLSLLELMAVLSRLMMLRWQYDEVCRTGGFPNELPIALPLNVDISRLATGGEETKAFLSRLSFGES
jgi:hypothetical protein